MENKTLKDMFPNVSLNEDTDKQEKTKEPETIEELETAATKAAKKAASELLSILDDNEKKSKRVVVRVDEKTFDQLNAICKKKGNPFSTYIRAYIVDFIRENENLLD